MTPSKPPTPQGISALLKRAGFERSVYRPGGSTTGYQVSRSGEDAVRVKHHFWSLMGGDQESWLAKYSKAITDAGWCVEADGWGLIVTAGKEG